ncbi:MAG: periplasmic heavy metal sensor [Pseudomonadota bacterium]
MKKKFAALTAAVGLAALISTSALAAPGGPGMGAGYGPGYHMGQGWSQLTPEQQAEASKAHAEFLNQTLALRQNLAAKRAELGTLYAQPTPDQAKIKALSDEMVDLGAALAKKRNEFAAKYPNAFGGGFGRGRGFHGGGGCGGPGGGGYGGGGGMMGGGWR